MEKLLLSLKKMVIQICRVEDITAEQIPNTAPVIGGREILKLDSIDAVEIAMFIEKNFKLKADGIPLKKIFRSFQELATYIETHAKPEDIQIFTEKYK